MKTTDIYFFTVLENRCLKPRCQQGHVLSEVSNKKLSLLLSAPGGPTYSLGYRSITPGSASVFILPSPVSLCVLSSQKDVSHWIRVHPNPVWLHLNWITFAMTLFQKDHILRFLVDMDFWETLFKPPYSEMGHYLILFGYLSPHSYL